MAIFCSRKFCKYNTALSTDKVLHKFETEDIRYCVLDEIYINEKGKCTNYKREKKKIKE